jgi:hypothetical protein
MDSNAAANTNAKKSKELATSKSSTFSSICVQDRDDQRRGPGSRLVRSDTARRGSLGVVTRDRSRLTNRKTAMDAAQGSAMAAAKMMQASQHLSNEFRGSYKRAQWRLDHKREQQGMVERHQARLANKRGVAAAWSTITSPHAQQRHNQDMLEMRAGFR